MNKIDKQKVNNTRMAGFIGHHLAKLLLKNNYQGVGMDNINDEYDQSLKLARLDELAFNTSEIDYNKL